MTILLIIIVTVVMTNMLYTTTTMMPMTITMILMVMMHWLYTVCLYCEPGVIKHDTFLWWYTTRYIIHKKRKRTSVTYLRGFVEWLESKYVLSLRKLQLRYGQVVGNIRDRYLSSVKLEFASITTMASYITSCRVISGARVTVPLPQPNI